MVNLCYERMHNSEEQIHMSIYFTFQVYIIHAQLFAYINDIHITGGRPGLIFPYVVWKYQTTYCYFKPYGNFNTMSLFELWQCQVVVYHAFLLAIVFRGVIHSI